MFFGCVWGNHAVYDRSLTRQPKPDRADGRELLWVLQDALDWRQQCRRPPETVSQTLLSKFVWVCSIHFFGTSHITHEIAYRPANQVKAACGLQLQLSQAEVIAAALALPANALVSTQFFGLDFFFVVLLTMSTQMREKGDFGEHETRSQRPSRVCPVRLGASVRFFFVFCVTAMA